MMRVDPLTRVSAFRPSSSLPLMSLKSAFKIIRNLVLGLVALLAVFVGVVYSVSSHRLHRKHFVEVQPITVPTDAIAIDRGRHIVATRACGDCHGSDFGGHKVIDDPLAGVFHGANLTKGTGGLPADFSDLDFVRAIRHGVTREGRALALMPSQEYAAMSDEDLGSVIAYLKTLPPVDRPRGGISPGPVLRLLMVLGQVKLAAEEIDHHASHIAAITPAITPEYGKYLASSCTGCHGPNMSGGKIVGAPPDWPSAANLTPHASSRISKWTQDQFETALRTRERPDGTKLNPIMPAAFAQLSDLEVKALWSYISTLPPQMTGVR